MSGSIPGRQDTRSSKLTPAPQRRPNTGTLLSSSVWSIRFWIECLCFFLIATPFELEMGSGYAYALKAFACVLLLLPRLAFGRATIDARIAGVVMLALLFLAINIQNSSERAISAFVTILLGASIGLLKSESWNRRLLEIVTVYILVHLAGFAFGLAEYLLRGSVIDLHAMLFPAQSRAHALGSAARLSGLHNEPGTYAQWMLMVTFLRCLLMQRIVSPLTIVVGASALVTVSLWAIIGVALLLIAVLLDAITSGRMRQRVQATAVATLLCSAAVIATAALPGSFVRDALLYLGVKAEMSTISALSKIWAFQEIQAKLSDILVLGGPLNPGFCPQCASPQDLGTWASSAYYFGVIPYLALVATLSLNVLRVHGVAYLPFLAIMLVWKATFYDPLLWIIIGYALVGPSEPRQRLLRSLPRYQRTRATP